MMTSQTSHTKYRIGYYSDTNSLGGSEIYLKTLLEHIDKNEYDVFLFCPPGHPLIPFVKARNDVSWIDIRGEPHDVPQPDGISLPSNTSSFTKLGLLRRIWNQLGFRSLKLLVGTLKEIVRLRRLFCQFPMDIMHFNDTGCEPPVIAARLAGIKRIVGTLHVLPSYDAEKTDGVRRLIEFFSLRSLHQGIAVSKATKNAWVERTRVSPQKIVVIYNGIDLGKIEVLKIPTPKLKQEWEAFHGCSVVVVPARLHPMKGHEYLISAIPQVVKTNPCVRFLFVGDGELKEKLQQQAKRENVFEYIKFLGFREDIMAIMSLADLIVLPSVALEALPYVILEAMAVEKPVIASNFSGIPEVIEDSVSGYLVPPQDSESLRIPISKLLCDKEKMLSMGQEGRRRVEQFFRQDDMLTQTFCLIRGYFPH